MTKEINYDLKRMQRTSMKQHRENLTRLLTDFFKDQKKYEDLNSYAWDLLEYYADLPDDKMPEWQGEDEGLVWNAVWPIQHMADEEHIKDGTAQLAFENMLQLLNGTLKATPADYGSRPDGFRPKE